MTTVCFIYLSVKKKEIARPASASTWYLSIMGHYDGIQSSLFSVWTFPIVSRQ